jgi:predicted O-linked N-acetylglucosamine transferase (SPINDLY family)
MQPTPDRSPAPKPAADPVAAALRPILERAIALHKAGRLIEARAVYEAILASQPRQFDALNNLGVLCKALHDHRRALELFDRAAAVDPGVASLHVNRGNLLAMTKRYEEALASYDRALAVSPAHAEAHYARGCVEKDRERYDAALQCFSRALALNPRHPDAHYERGMVLQGMQRLDEAIDAFGETLRINPVYPFAKGSLLHAKMLACDWAGLDALDRSLRADVAAARRAARPFGYQGLCDDEASLRRCAEIFTASRFPRTEVGFPRRLPGAGPKLRIGYVCGEFREQATSILMAEAWELHDRDAFELHAFDAGWSDASPRRARIERSFDRLTDISRKSDLDAARLVHESGIDVLVDMNGFFGRGRQGVFAMCPAPIQVTYPGFPGTSGADYMDYLIADPNVVPDASRKHYREQVVRLPHCYQANDRKRPMAERVLTRVELGLPAGAFVFCCFNNSYKITPATFASWMRILQAVEGSVLWLRDANPVAVANLRREAERRGVSGARLVFAPIVQPPEHLSRHSAADLVLDTLPYNAHTTASDALWSGVPVVTLEGSTFPGRVAASLLKAVGLPGLVTHSVADYEALAVGLARHPGRLADAKATLVRNRRTAPLFDTPRTVAHLEAAYRAMVARARAGLPPAAIDIAP